MHMLKTRNGTRATNKPHGENKMPTTRTNHIAMRKIGVRLIIGKETRQRTFPTRAPNKTLMLKAPSDTLMQMDVRHGSLALTNIYIMTAPIGRPTPIDDRKDTRLRGYALNERDRH